MSAISNVRPSKIRPAVVVCLLLFAAAAWGWVSLRQSRTTPVRQHLEAGMEYVRQGKGQKAVNEWREVVKRDPKNAEAWELLGEFYLSVGNFPAGVEPFQKLRTLKPDSPLVNARLATCLLWAGDEIGAFQAAQEELKRNPNEFGCLALSAVLLGQMNDQQRQLGYLRQLVKLAPDDPDFLRMLTETLIGRQLFSEARPYLDHAIALFPDDAEPYSLRGVAQFNEDPSPQGLAKAEADFMQALKANPLAPFPRLYLGKIYKKEGKYDKALYQLEEAARVMPDKLDIIFELAGVYELTHQPQKAAVARKRFEALRKETDRENALVSRCAVHPDDFENHLELGLLKMKHGDYRKADYYLNRAHLLNANDPRPLAALQKLAAANGASGSSASIQNKASAAIQNEATRAGGR